MPPTRPLATSSVASDLRQTESVSDSTLPTPPSFDDVAADRDYRKQCLVDALHILGKLGFAEGAAGHITVRDPEHPDRFWVNPFGMAFTTVEAQDLLEVSHDGQVLTGSRPLNNAAFAIHGAIHAARPDLRLTRYDEPHWHGRSWGMATDHVSVSPD